MNTPQMLIGLAGLAETGKTTVARALCRALELRHFILAAPITQACAAALDIPHHDFLAIPKNDTLPAFGISKRQFMQEIGDQLIRHNPRALISLCELRMLGGEHWSHTAALYNGSLISDIRTPAEAEWIRQKGGKVIHITNPNAPPARAHRTEQKLPIEYIDIELKNTGTLDELDTKLTALAHTLRDEFLQREVV